MSAQPTATPLADSRSPWWRWLFVVPGLAAVAYGAQGLLSAGSRIPLGSWLTWFVGSALVHDLLIAPAVLLIGAVVARLVPLPAQRAVHVGVVVSGVLILVALPFVLGYGAKPSVPSFLPRDYGRNLLLLLAGIWAVVLVWAAVAVRRDRIPGDGDSSGGAQPVGDLPGAP